MAIAYVTGSSGGGAGVNSYNLGAITTGANALILVGTHVSNSGDATPSASGLTFDQIGTTIVVAGTRLRIWRAFTVDGVTSKVITVTDSTASYPHASGVCLVFSGTDTSGSNGDGAIGTTADFSGTSTNHTVDVVTTRADSLVVGLHGIAYNSAVTAGASQTIRQNILGGAYSRGVAVTQNAVTAVLGSTVTMNVTCSSQAGALRGIEILAPISSTGNNFLMFF